MSSSKSKYLPIKKRLLMYNNKEKSPVNAKSTLMSCAGLQTIHSEEDQVKENRETSGLCFKVGDITMPTCIKNIDGLSTFVINDSNTDEVHSEVCTSVGKDNVSFIVIDSSKSDHEEVGATSKNYNEKLPDSDSEYAEQEVEMIKAPFEICGSKDNNSTAFEENLIFTDDQNNNETLPEGWVKIIHDSGLPVYFHMDSKVCTTTRPYILGSNSARQHDVPISAIPCLNNSHKRKITLSGSETKETPFVSNEEVHSYCKNLFRFEKKFSLYHETWKIKREYDKIAKQHEREKRLSPSQNEKLLRVPLKSTDGSVNNWTYDLTGRSFVGVLYDYAQKVLNETVRFEVEEVFWQESSFSATVYIGDVQYGSGLGRTKKNAKNHASRLALTALLGNLPGLREIKVCDQMKLELEEDNIFDCVKGNDPKVTDFCKDMSQPLPFSMLQAVLAKNVNMKYLKVQHSMVNEGLKQEYHMTVGPYSAKVECSGKVDGKQRAAQVILREIHPHIKSWGGLMRLYSVRSVTERREQAEKMKEDEKVEEIQDKKVIAEPNSTLMSQLKEEMLKLKVKREGERVKGMVNHHRDLLLPGQNYQLAMAEETN